MSALNVTFNSKPYQATHAHSTAAELLHQGTITFFEDETAYPVTDLEVTTLAEGDWLMTFRSQGNHSLSATLPYRRFASMMQETECQFAKMGNPLRSLSFRDDSVAHAGIYFVNSRNLRDFLALKGISMDAETSRCLFSALSEMTESKRMLTQTPLDQQSCLMR